MLKNAVLLDTVTVDKPSKRMGANTVFLHHFYCPVTVDGKLYVTEELVNGHTFYLTKIEMAPNDSTGLLRNEGSPLNSSSGAEVSVAQIFDFVKRNWEKFESDSKNAVPFEPKPVNPAMLNEDGTPKEFYHGTDAEYDAFDMSKPT